MIQRIAVVALAAGLPLSLGGCVLATKEQVTTIPVPHQAGTAITVTARNGHITVKRANGPEVQIVATLRMVSDERLAATTIAANRDASGMLTVEANPPQGIWKSNEGCGFDISIPDAAGVNLKSSNGRILIAGLSGEAELKTSNGAITVEGHNGPINADTSNGRITIAGATGPVVCDTSNGAVSITLADSATGPVTAESSNGSITLVVGKSFNGKVAARTSNGSVKGPTAMDGYPAFAFERVGRSSARISVGAGGEESTLKSSNGSISVRFAE